MMNSKKLVNLISLVVLLATYVLSPLSYATAGEEDMNMDDTMSYLFEQGVEGEIHDNQLSPDSSLSRGENDTSLIMDGDAKVRDNLQDFQSTGQTSIDLQNDEREDLENYKGTGENSAIDILKDIIENFTGDMLTGDTEKVIGETLSGDAEKSEIELAREITNKNEIKGSYDYRGVTVDVLAKTGSFPDGTFLSIIPITGKQELNVIKDQIIDSDVLDSNQLNTEIIAFDISFLYKLDSGDTVELQPRENTVQIMFDYSENEELKKAEENIKQGIEVFHINDKNENGEKVKKGEEIVERVEINEEKSEKVDNAVIIDAENFSVYTVAIRLVIDETSYTEINQLKNWNADDLELYFIEDEDTINHLTIMDRNLGATERYNGDYENPNESSYGYYYQRGNNYGFDVKDKNNGWGVGNIKKTSIPVEKNVWENYEPSKYGRDEFCTGYSWMEGAPDSIGIWGGSGDTLLKDGDGTTMIGRQGPCPDGYHVPSVSEWNNVYKIWDSRLSSDQKENHESDIPYWRSSSLLLPFAGYINHHYATYYGNKARGMYQSSSSHSSITSFTLYFGYFNYYNKYAVVPGYVPVSFSEGDHPINQTMGLPVRCFKNEDNQQKIHLYLNGGKDAIVGIISETNQLIFSSSYGPEKEGVDFMGWYTTSNFVEGTSVEMGSNITNVKALYARYSDQEETPLMSATLLGDDGQRNNFKYWTITITGSDGVSYTIMDRNLGARVAWDGTIWGNNSSNYGTVSDFYGYYYQWGNNYGFSSENGVIDKEIQNITENSTYSNNKWNKNLSRTLNRNLWGDYTKTEDSRQGPCPDGWHVPSFTDWNLLIKAWSGSANKSTDEVYNYRNFAKDLKLPLNGDAYISSNQPYYGYSNGTAGLYRSSTPTPYGFLAPYYVEIRSEVDVDTYWGDWDSLDGFGVRCLKNSNTHMVVFESNSGSFVEPILIQENSTPMEFDIPSKEGYTFMGWYRDDGILEDRVYSSLDIHENTTLYAKWEKDCGEGKTYSSVLDVCYNPNKSRIIRDSGSNRIIQINNQDWNDLELLYMNGDGTKFHYTMMDRNVGAKEAGMGRNSYGYFYQRGNNYGFLPCALSTGTCNGDIGNIVGFRSEVGKIIWEHNTPSKYASNMFVFRINWMKDASTTDNIRGGAGDKTSQNGSGSFIDRQGPCPDGYYVPSVYDQRSISNLFDDNTLLLPGAGYIEYYLYDGRYRDGYRYRLSSSPSISNSDRVYLGGSEGARGRAYPVRCLKNAVSDKNININLDGGDSVKVAFTGDVGNGKFTTLSEPKKQHYVFIGWYSDSDFVNEVNVGDSVVGDLYTKWEKLKVVTFHPNSGTLYTTVYEVKGGDTIGKSIKPSRTSYSFEGWYRDEGLTQSFDPMTDIVEDDMDVYAKWEKMKVVTFHPNGGSMNKTEYEVEKGKSVGVVTNPTKFGNEFEGWYRDEGLTQPFNPTTDIVEDDIDIYAKWIDRIPEYKLVYDANGGTFENGESVMNVTGKYYKTQNDFKYQYNYNVVIFEGLSKLYVSLYDISYGSSYFNWIRIYDYDRKINTTENLYKEIVVSSDDTYIGDDKFYVDGDTVTIYTAGYGGSYAQNPGPGYKATIIGFSENISEPTREGYDFLGWYTIKDGEMIDFDIDMLDSEENVTLYAKWGKSMGYIFDANGGIFKNGSKQQTGWMSMKFRIKTVGGGAPFVGRENLKFLGANSLDVDVTLWPYCKSSIDVVDKYGNIQTINGKNYNDGVFETEHVHIDGDTIIFSGGYGQYDSNGNYISDYCPVKYSAVISGVYYDFLDVVERPTRQGYYFGGWYTLENGEEVAFDMKSDLKDDNTIVYARWQESKYQPHQQSDPEYTEATLFPGNDFNTILKKLANPGNTSINAGSTDMNIKRFVRAENMPSEVSQNAQIISTGAKVYAWYDDSNGIGTIYYFSKADKIYMNGNSNVMFEYLKGLTNIDLSEFDTSRVTNMQAMFYNCTGLEKVRLDGWDLRKLNGGSNGIGGMFSNATNLKEVSTRGWKIPENFTHAMGCRTSSLCSTTGIEYIDVSNWDLSETKDINGLFGDSNVKTIKGLDTWDTSGVENMSQMFQNCSNLTGLDLSNWDTSNVTTMQLMFYNCSKLEDLNLDNWDLSISIIGNGSPMFYGTNSLKKLSAKNRKIPENFTHAMGCRNSQLCSTKLESIDVSNWDLSKTKDISGLFGDLKAKEIKGLDTWDTSGVENMSLMFQNCSNLTGLDLGSFNTSNTTNMYQIFGGCSKLEEINLSGWDFRKINVGSYGLMSSNNLAVPTTLKKLNMTNTKYGTTMNNAFAGLSSLEEIKLNGVDTSKVTDMGSVFAGCSNLTGLDLNDWNTSNVTNMGSMFGGCSRLENLKLDNWNLSKNPNMGSFIGGTISLKSISMSGWKIPEIFTNEIGRVWGNQNNSLEEIDVNNWDLSKTKDINGLFADSMKLKTIKGLNTWDTSGVENMSQMFQNCSNLVRLDLSSFDTSEVENMSNMFYGCSNLIGLDLSSFNTSNVTNMYTMFCGCSSLTGLDLSNFDTSNVSANNMQAMFNGCSKLEKLNLDNWVITGSSNTIGGMFGGDNNLKSVSMRNWTIPENFTHAIGCRTTQLCSVLDELDVSDWDLNNTKDIMGVFGNLTIKSLVGLDTWDTSHIQRMENVFGYFSGVDYLDLSGWNTENVQEMDGMFFGSNIKELDLSNFNTRNVTQMNSMFQDASNLKTVYVGENFKTDNVTNSSDMFKGAINIVGGNGTKFDLSYINEEYAKIDKVGQTGYFTDKFLITVKFINTLDGTETLSTFAKGQKLIPPSVDGYHAVGGYLDEAMIQEVDLGKGVDSYSEIYVKYERNESSSGSSGGGGVKPVIPKEEEKPDKTPDEIPQQDNQHGSSSEDENDKKDSSIESSKEIETSSYTNEQKEAYEFAKENKITTTPNIQKANMDGKLTRIAMAKMLSQYAINVLGKRPDISKTIKFNDVTAKRDADYDNGVTLAYQLGIMGQNMKNNKFRPDDEVSRAEFVTALSRLLYATSDGEYKNTSKYYIPHMEKLVSEGIITKADPSMKERRGYVMIMLMRSVK